MTSIPEACTPDSSEAQKCVLLLLYRLDSPIEHQILDGFSTAVTGRGYQLISGVSPFDPRAEVTRLIALHGKRIAGLAIQPYVPNKELAELLLTNPVRNLPHMIIGHHYEDILFNACVADNYGGMYEATRHLIRCGRRAPVFIGEIIPSSTEHERYLGFSDACLDEGIKVPKAHVIRHFNESHLIKNLCTLFDANGEGLPDAIVCMHDDLGAKVLKALKGMNVDVPGQVAVISYGDDIGIADKCQPPLSSVHHPAMDLGTTAGHLLLNLIENRQPNTPATYCVPVTMSIRESCGTQPGQLPGGQHSWNVPFSNFVGRYMTPQLAAQAQRG